MGRVSAKAVRGLRWIVDRSRSNIRLSLLKATYPGFETFGKVSIGPGATIHVSSGGSLEIRDCRLGKGVTITVASGARMVINADYIGQYCTLVARDSISIGAGTKIAELAVLRDADHDHSVPLRAMRFNSSRITVGDDVWIGAGCTVLKGVDLGNGSTIGAGSVVTKNVPASTVVVGVPAREVSVDRT